MNYKVSVVILNWNGKSLLESYLSDVIKYSSTKSELQAEIVVADNGSTDGSIEYLKEKYSKEVRIIDLKENHGFADGYNLALKQVDSEYVVLLNSDVEVTEGWLDILIDFLDSNTDVAACQPKIRSLRNRDLFEHAGGSGGFIDILGYPFCRGRVLSVLEKDIAQYDDVVDIFWATGACLCIRMDEYKNSGGLDAGFFAHMEEIDLCWRLRSRGKRIVCVPKSVVFHLGGATLNKENPHKTFLNYRNNLLMLYKNCSRRVLMPVMIIRFFLDYLSLLLFLLSGKPGDAKAVLRARLAFLKIYSSYRAKRLENLRMAENKVIPQIYKGSILLEYYLLGKKRFSEIIKD